MEKVHVIPKAPRNEGAIKALEQALEAAKNNVDCSNVMILMRIGGEYIRYSTQFDNPMEVISQCELAKADIIFQMAGITTEGKS